MDTLYALLNQTKRKLFVSYHHDNDQYYYNEFAVKFCDVYNVARDNSLERACDSDDPEYVMRRIREKHITGSSCTIVLCGALTPQRKYVDWEIKATLDKCHGLIGVNLPTSIGDGTGIVVPDRYRDNFLSGYSVWLHWQQLTPKVLTQAIETAISRSPSLINNSRPMRRRNG